MDRDWLRPPSPKRKRSEYEDNSPQEPNGTSDLNDGYAYDSSSPSPSDGDPLTPATPLPPTAPVRPTSLSYGPHLLLKGHTGPVSNIAFSPSGNRLASSSSDSTLKIWDLPLRTCTHTLEGHLAGISCLSWNPDGTVLASGSDDKAIRLWDTTTGKSYATPLLGHSNYVTCLAFSPKGNMLVSGSSDEAVFLWDVRTGQVMRQLPAHSDPVTGVDFVRDGTLVVSCSSDGLIRIWDAGTGQCLKTLVHEDNAAVGSVRFSPNGRFVLAATLDGCVRLWDYVEGRVVKSYKGHRNERYSLMTAFGTYGAKDHDLTMRRIERGDQMDEDVRCGEQRLVDQEPQMWAFIAIADEDGKLVLWDVNSKEVLQSIDGRNEPAQGIDVSPDSKMLATCGHDGTIQVWVLDGQGVNGNA